MVVRLEYQLIILYFVLLKSISILSSTIPLASKPVFPYMRLFQTSAPCGLGCWLGNLTFYIPDQQTQYSGDDLDFTLGLTNITCSHTVVTGLNSSLVSMGTNAPGIKFTASGIGIKCSALWRADGSFLRVPFADLHGDMIGVASDSTLNSEIHLFKDLDTKLVKSSNMTACLAKIIFSQITVTGFDVLQVLLDHLPTVIKPVLEAEIDKYTCEELISLVNNNLTMYLQEINSQLLPYMKQPQTPPSPQYPSIIADLTQSTIINFVEYILDDVVGPNGMNKIMNILTHNTGAFSFTLPPMEKSTSNLFSTFVNISNEFVLPRTSNDFTFKSGITQVNISGLNTWTNVNLLHPVAQQVAASHLGMRKLDVTLEFWVQVSAGKNDPYTLKENGLLQATLSDTSLFFDTVLAFDGEKFYTLVGNQLSDVHCMESTFYDGNVSLLYLDFNVDFANLTAIGGGIEDQLDSVINDIAALFIQSYATGIPAMLNYAVDDRLLGFINENLQSFSSKNYSCPEPQESIVDKLDNSAVTYTSAGGIVAYLLILVMIAIATRYFYASEMDPDVEDPLVQVDETTETERLLEPTWEHTSRTPSLILLPSIPPIIRYGVLFFLILNICTFVFSNTANSASVYAVITVNYNHTVVLPSVFDFSLKSSVDDMWQAKVYPLALLVAIFSGAWPYLKLLLMLACWLIPPFVLPLRWRGNILWLVDALGKWSLVDSLVMVLFMVAFHFELQPPQNPHSPPNAVFATTYVEPHWGYYIFVASTILSLVLSHLILYLHWASIQPDTPIPQGYEVLSLRVFPKKKRFSFLGTFAVVLSLLISIGFCFWGLWLNSYEFQFKGAFGMLKNYLGQQTNIPYSVINTGLSIDGAALDSSSIGIHLIQITFFIFVVVMPLLFPLMVIILWMVSLDYTWQRRILSVVEIFQAWSTLEVFVAAIVAAILQIQQFSLFMVGSRCDYINKMLKKYMNDLPLDGDARCFDVVATLQGGCWVLFAASIMYIIVGPFVIKACRKALEERRLAVTHSDVVHNIQSPTVINS